MRKIYLAIILLLCAAGCSKETVDSRFVGKWQHRTEDGYTVTISILPDGTGSYASDPCSVEIMDDYIVLDFGFSKPEFSKIAFSVINFTDTEMTLLGGPDNDTRVWTKL